MHVRRYTCAGAHFGARSDKWGDRDHLNSAFKQRARSTVVRRINMLAIPWWKINFSRADSKQFQAKRHTVRIRVQHCLDSLCGTFAAVDKRLVVHNFNATRGRAFLIFPEFQLRISEDETRKFRPRKEKSLSRFASLIDEIRHGSWEIFFLHLVRVLECISF